MPQMKPLLWLSMLLYTYIHLILLMVLTYFTLFLFKPISQTLNNNNLTPSSWTWKW